MLPILVTGSTGKIGNEMCSYLNKNNINYIPLNHNDLNLSQPKNIDNYLRSHEFSGVIHCAAWTNVNSAEENKMDCISVNAESTRIIAKNCEDKNIPLMLISTDYVFDGTKDGPWETDDLKNPLNVYGLSKSMAEDYVSSIKMHYIVRTSWVFGMNRHDFVKKIVKQSKENNEIKVSCNQIGSPTYVVDLVPLLYRIFVSKKYGTYHAHNEGFCSRSEFAKCILMLIGSKSIIVEIPTDNDNEKIKRPLNGMMSTSKLIKENFFLLPPWRDALERYLVELKQNSSY